MKTFTNRAHALLLIQNGATFMASGNVSNAGRIALASSSALSVGGDYAQSPSGTLQVTVAGTAPGSTYGHLAITGHASLSGVLKIVRGPGYAAKVGDTQQVVTAAAITAPFRRVLAAPAGPGLRFKVHYSPTAVTLTVGG